MQQNNGNKRVVRLNKSEFVNLVSEVARRVINESHNVDEWNRLDKDLAQFGDVRVARIYCVGRPDICLAVGPDAQRMAVKQYMESQGYSYYTGGAHGDYFMMDFKAPQD